MNRLESFLAESYKTGVKTKYVKTADRLVRDFNIGSRFELHPIQLELFQTYFAYYFFQNDTFTTGVHQAANHPVIEQTTKFGLLGAPARAVQKEDELNQEIVKEFESEAKSLELCWKREVLKTLFSIQIGHQINSQAIDALIEKNDPQILQILARVLPKVGSPTAIRNAANVLSTVYVQNKSNSAGDLQSAIEQQLNRVRIKES